MDGWVFYIKACSWFYSYPAQIYIQYKPSCVQCVQIVNSNEKCMKQQIHWDTIHSFLRKMSQRGCRVEDKRVCGESESTSWDSAHLRVSEDQDMTQERVCDLDGFRGRKWLFIHAGCKDEGRWVTQEGLIQPAGWREETEDTENGWVERWNWAFVWLGSYLIKVYESSMRGNFHQAAR